MLDHYTTGPHVSYAYKYIHPWYFCQALFEKWLPLGDKGGWGLRTLSHCHFERKREIFVIRGQNGQCLEASTGKPALQETFGHRHDRYSAALLIFMRRTTTREFESRDE